jgi:hypothetical protein
MAIDPYGPIPAGKRYTENQATTLLRLEDPKAHLLESASRIVRKCPPNIPWAFPFKGETYRGFFAGPTSVAYFFWSLSIKHDDFKIEDKVPSQWCSAYLELGQKSVLPLLEAGCGTANEYLASNSLKACLYKSQEHAKRVVEGLSMFIRSTAAKKFGESPSYLEGMLI